MWLDWGWLGSIAASALSQAKPRKKGLSPSRTRLSWGCRPRRLSFWMSRSGALSDRLRRRQGSDPRKGPEFRGTSKPTRSLWWAYLSIRLSVGGGPKARDSHGSQLLRYRLAVRVAKPADTDPIVAMLSSARLTKYTTVTATATDALELYAWNAHVSAALMVPSHFAEVLTRNAVDEALTAVHGPRWPWSAGFERSLPSPNGPGYNPRRDLQQTRRRHTSTGKVIADLKFVFWVKMFTARHDRVWRSQIHGLFPNAAGLNQSTLRNRIYDDLDHIRKLRNRLAHHEPILNRTLTNDLSRMLKLVELRSAETRAWLDQLEEASAGIAARP